MRTVYVNLSGINKLQEEIMHFVDWWAKNEKTPVPRKAIIDKMKESGVKGFTTINALSSLLKKGYIRRTYASYQNKTFYVQIRTI
jgi:hypothetical protein